jgi:AraC-like DNA-binding protein
LGKDWQQTVRAYRDVLHLSLSRADRLQWIKRSQLNRFRVFQCGWYVEAHQMFWERQGLNEGIYIYCTAGKGFYRSAGCEWTILPGDLLYCPPLTHHSYGADPYDPWTIFWMHVSGPEIGFYCNLFRFALDQPVRQVGIRPRVIATFRTLFHFMKAPLTDARMAAISHSAQLALATLAIEVGEEAASEAIGAGVQCVVDHMERHVADSADLDAWLKLFGGSRSHFQRQFKRATGHAPRNYFLRLKIRAACSLLAASELRVGEIADRVGFADPYYFSRCFHRLTGVSPRRYRARIAQHESTIP